MLAKTLSHKRILLAEDDESNRFVELRMLELLGAGVVVEWNGIDALARARNQPFDVILLDLHLPGMSGIDICRALREHDEGPRDTPIVAVTVHTLPHQMEEIEAAGFDGIIAKPIEGIEAFGAALARIIERRTEECAALINKRLWMRLEREIGGEAMRKLQSSAMKELYELRQRLMQAIEPVDRTALQCLSHAILSVATTIGAEEVLTCLEPLRRAAAGDADAAVLKDQTRGTIAALDRLLSALGASRQQER